MAETRPGLDIALIGGHELTRYGLRLALEAEPDFSVVAEASSVVEAVTIVSRTPLDIVLIDTVHPGKKACALLHALRRHGAGVPALVVTSKLCDCNAQIFAAGARGMVLWDAGPRQLANAIRNIAAGYAVVPGSLTCRLADSRPREPTRIRRPPVDTDKLDRLTPRERDVLRCLVTGASNAEAAEQLNLGEGTVKSHVQHLLSKLDVRDRVQAIVYAYESGFVTAGQPPAFESVGRLRPVAHAG
jgi:DNA-binding NarL/FixJ family response regulator